MAFEPYLSERSLNCSRLLSCPKNHFDPNCTVDESRQITRDRWNLLKSDPCQRPPLRPALNVCKILNRAHRPFAQTQNIRDDQNGASDCRLAGRNAACLPPSYDNGKTTYAKDFAYPLLKSHNIVDDCCSTPCPCEDKFPELPTNIYYCASEAEKCPPLETCTTYRHFYVPHSVCPRERRETETWDPCECPMEECSITRSDYTRKEPTPTGPAPTEVIKHGLWSTEQFCKEFTDETTAGTEFKQKCAERRRPLKGAGEIGVYECCPMREDTTTRVDFRPRIGEDPCYPHWISNDEYRKPDTNMERCTTNKHFFKPYCIQTPRQSLHVATPGAIPFCTMNQLCYSCHDPEPHQKTPVEMRDNDPWPYVKPTPIHYTDNVQTDPCASFSHATTYKEDYYAKTTCGRRPSLRPPPLHVPSLVPLNDDTTMKCSFPAYNLCQYQDAVGNAGNPNGIDWGPFACEGQRDKCLPRFIAPYGNPLKPFLNSPHCPCGPFDNRSSYNRDFIFRTPEIVAKAEDSMCREVNVPKGDSDYRSSFLAPGGKKAVVMEPPSSKAYRCMNPCSFRDTNTLYRLDYFDFYKNLPRDKLDLYRGKRAKSRATEKEACGDDGVDVETQVVFVPVCGEKKTRNGSCQTLSPPSCSNFEDVDLPKRYREIAYTGENIRNRPKTPSYTIDCK